MLLDDLPKADVLIGDCGNDARWLRKEAEDRGMKV